MAFEMRALKEFSRIFPVEKKILERSYGEELEGAEDTEGKSKPVGVTVIVFVSEKMELKITLLTNLSPLLRFLLPSSHSHNLFLTGEDAEEEEEAGCLGGRDPFGGG